MSSGQRIKFQGTEIAAATSYAGTQAITGASKANPCVLTVVAHDFEVGDVTKPSGILGMTELNGKPFIISATTTDSITLRGVDSTNYGTYVSGGVAPKGVFSNFCELTGFDRSGGAASEIDATTICSDAKEFEVGLQAFGNVKLDYNFAPSTVQSSMEDAKESGDPLILRRILPQNAGATLWKVLVLELGETGQIDDLWKGTANLKITGSPYNYIPTA